MQTCLSNGLALLELLQQTPQPYPGNNKSTYAADATNYCFFHYCYHPTTTTTATRTTAITTTATPNPQPQQQQQQPATNNYDYYYHYYYHYHCYYYYYYDDDDYYYGDYDYDCDCSYSYCFLPSFRGANVRERLCIAASGHVFDTAVNEDS